MLAFFALVAAGFVAAVVNVLAGGGSFLTLPLLIFLGLPATEANATNRVGVVAQNAGAVWAFHRHRVLDSRWALAVAAPGLLGAALGAWLALHVGDRTFQRLLALIMLVLALWTLAAPRERWPGAGDCLRRHRFVLQAGFFGAGLYAGFVQAGVGFLILALTTLAGFDLVRGNAVKVLCILLQTSLALVIFAAGGKVQWVAGLALATGSLLGSALGVRLVVLKSQRWLQRVVTTTIVLFALRLLFSG